MPDCLFPCLFQVSVVCRVDEESFGVALHELVALLASLAFGLGTTERERECLRRRHVIIVGERKMNGNLREVSAKNKQSLFC
jgi:hypothetical protein